MRHFQLAPMERFVLKEEAHSMRDVWRFVATSSGEQCVITCGLMLMQQLLADTWDILDSVSFELKRSCRYYLFLLQMPKPSPMPSMVKAVAQSTWTVFSVLEQSLISLTVLVTIRHLVPSLMLLELAAIPQVWMSHYQGYKLLGWKCNN